MELYGDPFLPGEDFSPEQLDRFLSENTSLEKIWLYDTPGFTAVCRKYGFLRMSRRNIPILDLSKSEEELWDELSVKRRNGIRYAIKHGVIIERATSKDAEAFRPVWVDGYCKKYGMETESADARIRHWIDTESLFVARLSTTGQIIAGTVYRNSATRDPKAVAVYSVNTSLIEFQRYKPNELLLWEIIKWTKSEGYREFCMGGDNLFKNQFTKRFIPVDYWLKIASPESIASFGNLHGDNFEDIELCIKGPVAQEIGNCWKFYFSESDSKLNCALIDESDNDLEPLKSSLRLFEGAIELNPSHSSHALIRTVGRGAFSHWKGSLYFSTSDNSNPNSNDREYKVIVQVPTSATGLSSDEALSREIYAYIYDKFLAQGENLYQWYRLHFLPYKAGLSPWDIAVANFVAQLNDKFARVVEIGAGFGQGSLLLASKGIPTLAIETNLEIFGQMTELIQRVKANVSPEIDRFLETRFEFFPNNAASYLNKDVLLCSIDLSYGLTDEQEEEVFKAIPLAGGFIIGLKCFFRDRDPEMQNQLIKRIVSLGFSEPVDIYNSYDLPFSGQFDKNRIVYFKNIN